MAEITYDVVSPFKAQGRSSQSNRHRVQYLAGEPTYRNRGTRRKIDQADKYIKSGKRNHSMDKILSILHFLRDIIQKHLGRKKPPKIWLDTTRKNPEIVATLASQYPDIASAVKKWEQKKPTRTPPAGWCKPVNHHGRRHYLRDGKALCNSIATAYTKDEAIEWRPAPMGKQCTRCVHVLEGRHSAWDNGLYLYPHECLRCGNKWMGKVASPNACPKCQSKIWNMPGKSGSRGKTKNTDPKKFPWHHTCLDCHHEWNGKIQHVKQCPKCHRQHHTTSPR